MYCLIIKSKALMTMLQLAVVLAASAEVVKVSVDLLDRQAVMARLHAIERDNRKREAVEKQLFTEAGCSQHLEEQPVKDVKVPNVICVLPGESDNTIVVGAHTDHVEMGMGAVDNWTGAALLPSLYQTLAEKPRHHTFVFVGFTDEERGLVGSRFYVASLGPEAKSKIKAMVNFDSLGRGRTDVWGNVKAPELTQAYAAVAKALGEPATSVTIGLSDADSDSFSRANIPAITLHALATEGDLRLLHSVRDQMREVDADAYYGNYRFASYYLVYLDQQLR